MTDTRTDAFAKGYTPPFEVSAKESLEDHQLRRNLGKATKTIREKRAAAVEELPDWEELREAGRALKERSMRHLDDYLVQLEKSVEKAGGKVHWARDADEANNIITGYREEPRGAGGRQGKVHSHRRDQAERAPRRGGHRRFRDGPRGAYYPVGRGDLVAHPGTGDPQEPGGDPGFVHGQTGPRRPL